MKKILFIIGFTIYVIVIFVSCTGVKHLTKTIDKALEKKDVAINQDSLFVSTDTSKYNTEIVIEYADTAKLADDCPVTVDVSTDPMPSVHSTQKVKRVIIKTKTDLHLKDSAITRNIQTDKTQKQEFKKDIVEKKKTTSYWWVLLLLIPVIYLLYEKYKKWLPF